MEDIKVWVDGACFPNPGKGGWGWTTLKGQEGCGGQNPSTNNIMELQAPIQAIRALYSPGMRLLVLSDSQYVVKGITEWIHGWLKSNWKNNTIKNQEYWKELYSLVTGRPINFEWVKGHAGDKGNEAADRLAILGSRASPDEVKCCERGWIKKANKKHFSSDFKLGEIKRSGKWIPRHM